MNRRSGRCRQMGGRHLIYPILAGFKRRLVVQMGEPLLIIINQMVERTTGASGGHGRNKVEALYEAILMEYIIRLEKEEKKGVIPPNMVEHIDKKIKELLGNPLELLKTSYKNQLKKEELEKEEKLFKQRQEDERTNLMRQESMVKQEEPDEDDFALFEKARLEESQKKQNQNPDLAQLPMTKQEEPMKTQEIPEQPQDHNYYQERARISKAANQNLDMSLQGIFFSCRKKYIAKSQKTKLDLEDVFVRFRDREIMFKTITCELTTIKPDEIRF